MKFAALSDMHGQLPNPKDFQEVDVVLIAGDVVPLQYQRSDVLSKDWFEHEFVEWCNALPCRQIVMVGGNHDFYLQRVGWSMFNNWIRSLTNNKVEYLYNNMFELLNGVRIYGTPWCEGPFGWAFSPCDTKPDIHGYYDEIPDCEILLTHQPPRVDNVGVSNIGTAWQKNFGSQYLADVINDRVIKVVVSGHIHSGEHGGIVQNGTKFFNVSILHEDYRVFYPITYFEL